MLGLNGSALSKNRIDTSAHHELDASPELQLEDKDSPPTASRSSNGTLSVGRSSTKHLASHRGPKPLLPRSLKEALQLASLLSKSRLIPKGFENPEACLVGILYGMEVGLSPIAALQRMAIIDGRPTIWGDAALALVEVSGLLEKIEERIESDQAQAKTAVCQVLRSGRSEPITRTFSIEDAKRAGLWQKPGPWTYYPDRMLMMRARAFALRDAFPDVLMGLYFREEFEGLEAETRYAKPELGSGSDPTNSGIRSDPKEKSYLRSNYSNNDLEWESSDRPIKTAPTSKIRRAPPPPMAISEPSSTLQPDNNLIRKDAASADPSQSTDPAGNETSSFLNPSETLELFDSALACARDAETLEEIREEFNERIDRLDSGSLQEAGRIFLRHEKRIKTLEEAFKTSSEPSDTTLDQDPLIVCSDRDKSKGGLGEIKDQLEECEDELLENASGRIGKEPLSPYRRRFSVRPKRGLSLAELNARRKIDLLKYMPRFRKIEEDSDED